MFRSGLSLAMAAAILCGCGGGGDVAGDVSGMSLLPSSIKMKCVGDDKSVMLAGVHSINGGQPPFRVRSHVPGVEIGYAAADNTFVAPPASAFNAEGDLVISGKDPKFAVRYLGLVCGGGASEAAVTVLDYHSATVSPSYTAEAAGS